MLRRAHRFHGYGSLRYVYQHGHNVRGTAMGVRSVMNRRRTNYRLAVVVSKKVHKSAVVRNRIRRRIFEIVRRHSDSLKPNQDIVITVFQENVETMPAAELEDRLLQLFERAHLLISSDEPAHRDIIETEEN